MVTLTSSSHWMRHALAAGGALSKRHTQTGLTLDASHVGCVHTGFAAPRRHATILRLRLGQVHTEYVTLYSRANTACVALLQKSCLTRCVSAEYTRARRHRQRQLHGCQKSPSHLYRDEVRCFPHKTDLTCTETHPV